MFTRGHWVKTRSLAAPARAGHEEPGQGSRMTLSQREVGGGFFLYQWQERNIKPSLPESQPPKRCDHHSRIKPLQRTHDATEALGGRATAHEWKEKTRRLAHVLGFRKKTQNCWSTAKGGEVLAWLGKTKLHVVVCSAGSNGSKPGLAEKPGKLLAWAPLPGKASPGMQGRRARGPSSSKPPLRLAQQHSDSQNALSARGTRPELVLASAGSWTTVKPAAGKGDGDRPHQQEKAVARWSFQQELANDGSLALHVQVTITPATAGPGSLRPWKITSLPGGRGSNGGSSRLVLQVFYGFTPKSCLQRNQRGEEVLWANQGISLALCATKEKRTECPKVPVQLQPPCLPAWGWALGSPGASPQTPQPRTSSPSGSSLPCGRTEGMQTLPQARWDRRSQLGQRCLSAIQGPEGTTAEWWGTRNTFTRHRVHKINNSVHLIVTLWTNYKGSDLSLHDSPQSKGRTQKASHSSGCFSKLPR